MLRLNDALDTETSFIVELLTNEGNGDATEGCRSISFVETQRRSTDKEHDICLRTRYTTHEQDRLDREPTS